MTMMMALSDFLTGAVDARLRREGWCQTRKMTGRVSASHNHHRVEE